LARPELHHSVIGPPCGCKKKKKRGGQAPNRQRAASYNRNLRRGYYDHIRSCREKKKKKKGSALTWHGFAGKKMAEGLDSVQDDRGARFVAGGEKKRLPLHQDQSKKGWTLIAFKWERGPRRITVTLSGKAPGHAAEKKEGAWSPGLQTIEKSKNAFRRRKERGLIDSNGERGNPLKGKKLHASCDYPGKGKK